ncbi:hypothetical protein RJ639_039357 [Escallonia herrerae]|uniref:RRM domain-containing protein n=1 Tax=Escallonia herrerae TaxID=1293975 RepID=A0AA89BCR5_9ASTE|nr:hypothetical protein RJ639_039357 [Escallonia herrerae]
MTVDDENSVYVGGLSYDATEDSLRETFSYYGSIVAVKIVNDRGVGGKCYGFVTFRNPQSAVQAMDGMDGQIIDGRTVKVNEVRTRGVRSNFGRDTVRRNSERGMEWDRSRDRERDHEYDRDRYRVRHRERSRDRDQDRERGFDRARENDRTRDRFLDRDRGREQDRDREEIKQEHDKNRDQEWERDLNSDRDQDREVHRTTSYRRSGDKEKERPSKILNGLEVGKRMDVLNQKLGELQKEVCSFSTESTEEIDNVTVTATKQAAGVRICDMEELVEEKGQLVLAFQEKSQNLEDALAAAKKLTSHRQMQLTKLHKCFLQVKGCGERLKGCEQELQYLVDSTMMEVDYGDAGLREGVLANGDT